MAELKDTDVIKIQNCAPRLIQLGSLLLGPDCVGEMTIGEFKRFDNKPVQDMFERGDLKFASRATPVLSLNEMIAAQQAKDQAEAAKAQNASTDAEAAAKAAAASKVSVPADADSSAKLAAQLAGQK